MARDDPSRLFSKLTDEDRKSLVVKAYEQLKVSFEKYTKPSGDKAAPARTCRDLAVAHPELPSGMLNISIQCVQCDFHNFTCVFIPIQAIIGSIPTRVTLKIPSWSSVT